MNKRLIAFALAIVLLSSLFSFFAQGKDTNMIGDINGDGEIDKYDYIYCKRAVLKTITLNDSQTDAADLNGYGTINSYD